MDDIQVIQLFDAIEVDSVKEALGVSPRSIILTSKSFENVAQVLINNMPSPSFNVFSSTQLIAEVPDLEKLRPISDILVLSASVSYTSKSLVEMTVGTRPRKVGGMVSLLQNFIRLLIRTQGSNLFSRNTGGSLLKRVGKVLSYADRDRIIGDAAVAIGAVRQQFIAAQSRSRGIPASERLLNAEITGARVDPQQGTLYLTVVLTNHSGKRGAATLAA